MFFSPPPSPATPQCLRLCHNGLTSLPPALCELTGLAHLDISTNTELRELPAGMGDLTGLTHLAASHMRLKSLAR
jgi:Leucine-rich repeat (LRR) protein